MPKPKTIKLTEEQLKRFYLEAFNQGASFKLMAGSCGDITTTSDIPTHSFSIALMKAFSTKDKRSTT